MILYSINVSTYGSISCLQYLVFMINIKTKPNNVLNLLYSFMEVQGWNIISVGDKELCNIAFKDV